MSTNVRAIHTRNFHIGWYCIEARFAHYDIWIQIHVNISIGTHQPYWQRHSYWYYGYFVPMNNANQRVNSFKTQINGSISVCLVSVLLANIKHLSCDNIYDTRNNLQCSEYNMHIVYQICNWYQFFFHRLFIRHCEKRVFSFSFHTIVLNCVFHTGN